MGPEGGVPAASVEFLSGYQNGNCMVVNTDLLLPGHRKANAKEGEFHMMAVFLLERNEWSVSGFPPTALGGKGRRDF